jgi:(4-alkanoyl-5-oxo-2,5-dihydrofuran-3-yl)methyl phosphate reductase
MILVTGASGVVGRLLLAELAGGGTPVRALTRDPQTAQFPPEVEPVGGDLGDPASLARALTGVRSVFLTGVGPQRPVHDRNLAVTAAACGVGHIVQLSSLAVEERRDAAPARARVLAEWHAAGGRAVRAAGMPWTILRPNGFMSNALQWAAAVRAGDIVRAPFGGLPLSAVDPADVAAAAAAALRDPGRRSGAVYRLTGPVALTPADQVRILGEVLDRKLRFAEQSAEEALLELSGSMPSEAADAVLAARQYADPDVRAGVRGGVADLTGRQPRSFRQWARAHEDRFSEAPEHRSKGEPSQA